MENTNQNITIYTKKKERKQPRHNTKDVIKPQEKRTKEEGKKKDVQK